MSAAAVVLFAFSLSVIAYCAVQMLQLAIAQEKWLAEFRERSCPLAERAQVTNRTQEVKDG